MKTLKLTLLFMTFLIVLTGCSSDDNNDLPEEPGKDESISLEGTWQFERLDFTDGETVAWDPEVEFNTGNYFGYAPVMFGGMIGFNFDAHKTEGGEGYIFDFVNDGDYNQNPESVYWYWNYTNKEQTEFEIQQLNPDMPPYNFSIMEITRIVLSDDENSLSFEAKLNSREVGGSLTAVRKVPVKITLTRGISAPQKQVDVFIEGVPFEEPKTLSAADKLIDLHWKLEPGSEVYDPGFSDQDPALEYRKVVALNLTKEEDDYVLRYRYSFPMGIVETKTYQQDPEKIDDKLLVTKHGGGSFGGDEQFIEWEIIRMDQEAGKLTLKEKESGEERVFVKIDDIDEMTASDKDDYTIVTE